MKRLLNLLLTSALFCTVSTFSSAFSQDNSPVGPSQKVAPIMGKDNKFIVRIGSIKMCPGEVADIPVYLQQYTPTQKFDVQHNSYPFNVTAITDYYPGSLGNVPVTSFQMNIWFADTSVVEPIRLSDGDNAGGYSPVIPYYHPFMANHGMFNSNYIVRPVNQPSITFPHVRVMWIYNPPTKDDIEPFVPDTNMPIFTIRVKMKKSGDASIYIDTSYSYVLGGYNGVRNYYTVFNGIVEPDRTYDLPSDVVNADFLRADPPVAGKTYHIGGRVTQSHVPVVYAGDDVEICVSDRISLTGASGGVGYNWQPINVAMDGIVSSRDVQKPTFTSSVPGIYRYQVKITDSSGCSSYDTVHVTVHPNLISTIMTRDSLIDSNSVFPFVAEVTSGSPSPLGMSYEPVEYIDGTASFTTTEDILEVNGKTNPLITPLLFTATSSDIYCAKEEPVLVNVRGSEVKGNISNFPIVRCGDDAVEAVTTLYLSTIGGSDALEYKWYATNMQIGTPNPEFINGDTLRNPTVKYYGQCAFTVNIYDPYTGKTTTISDTVEKKSPVMIENVIERVGEGIICHGDIGTFTAHLENLGSTPLLQWRINSRVVYESNSIDDAVWTTNLSKGDTVSLVVYSSDICAVNNPLVSNFVVPPTEYYSSMESTLGFGSGSSGACSETEVALNTLLRGMGNRFRLTWERNSSFYMSEIKNGYFYNGASITQNMPRSNYYDMYRSIITEVNVACLFHDTAYSDDVLVGRPAVAAVRMGIPITYDNYATSTCKDTTVTLYTDGIENLGESFMLCWLKYSAATGLVDTIGYYLYKKENISKSPNGDVERPEYPNNAWLSAASQRGIRDLGSLYSRYEVGYPNPMVDETPLSWFNGKFPLRINDEYTNFYTKGRSEIGNGDSVFYNITTIYHTGENCSTSVINYAESPKKAIVFFSDSVGILSIDTVNSPVCEGTLAIYTAKVKHDGGMARFEWKVNNSPVGTRGYTSPRGDTLYLKTGNSNNVKISVTATTSFPCANGFPITKEYNVTGLEHNTPILLTGDTMVCEGALATVHMDGGNSFFVDLATSVADLNNTPSPSVDQSRKSLTFNPDPETDGSYVYYRVKNTANECNFIDSAFVRTRPDIHINVMLTADPNGKLSGSGAEIDTLVWCASNNIINFHFDAYYEDAPGHYSLLDPSQYTFGWEFKPSAINGQEWEYFATGMRDRSQILRPEYSGRTMRIRVQNIKDINTCNFGPHYSKQLHYVFLPTPKFHSSVQTNYVFCDTTDLQNQKIKITMEDTVTTWYNYLWMNAADGSIASNSAVLDVSDITEQKVSFGLSVRDKDSACPAIWANINVTRGVYFPNRLYNNNSALDMDMIKVSTGEKVSVPAFCPGEDSVLMKLVFRPYLRSHTAEDRYSVIERPAVGINRQRLVRDVAPGDSLTIWFHRNYARAYIEHRIDTVGCGSPENYTWLEVYDFDKTSASTQIQPHVNYAKYEEPVPAFAISKDSIICSDKLVPITLTATGTGSADDGFVWLSADGLEPNDTSLLTVTVNPTVSTTYKGVLRLGNGCNIYDSAIIEVLSPTSIPYVKLSAKEVVVNNNYLALCGTSSGNFSLLVDKANSSVSGTFKRYEWYVNGVAVMESDSLVRTLNSGDSVYVKAYLLDELKACSPDSIAVSNVYKVKRYTAPSIVAAKDTVVCEGNSVLLSFGGTGLSYTLYNGSSRIDSNGTGVFTVTPENTTEFEARTFSDYEACYSFANTTVSINKIIVDPVVNISVSAEVACGNDTLEYDVVSASEDFRYEWFVNSKATGLNGSSFKAYLNSNDTVQCKGIYTGSDCIRPEDSVVWSNKIVSPRHDVPVLQRLLPFAADTSICEGISVQLSFDLGGATGSSWTPDVGSSASVVVTPSDSTTYVLSAWFNSACPASAEVRINVIKSERPMPSAIIGTLSSDQICGDTSVTYTLTSCISCDSAVWFVGSSRYASVAEAGGSIVRMPSAGFDTVSVYAYRVNSDGCDIAASAQSNLIIINRQLKPVVHIEPRDTTIFEGDILTLYAAGAEHLAWSPAIYFLDGVITGNEVQAQPNHTVQLRVTGYNYIFCTGIDVITVTVRPLPAVVDSEFVYIANAIVLNSPNPEDHILTVKGLKVNSADIKIYNTSGAKVFDQNGLIGDKPFVPVWDAQTASVGNYNYRISVKLSDGEIKTFRGWVSVIK